MDAFDPMETTPPDGPPRTPPEGPGRTYPDDAPDSGKTDEQRATRAVPSARAAIDWEMQRLVKLSALDREIQRLMQLTEKET